MLELWVPEGNQIKVNKWCTPLKNMITVWRSPVVPAVAIKSQPRGSKNYKGQLFGNATSVLGRWIYVSQLVTSICKTLPKYFCT